MPPGRPLGLPASPVYLENWMQSESVLVEMNHRSG
jgi:hypothetical protein